MSTRQIGQYELLEKIGHGATGRVWRARHLVTGDIVALKELRSEFADDSDARGRFIAEGQLLERHVIPGGVRVREVLEDGESVAIVMDLVSGITLRQLITDQAPLAPARAARLVMQLAESLTAAHADGVVHGDVKPENVLVTDAGTASEATTLTDFGLARVVRGSSRTSTRSQVMGTPHYAAPEIHRGQGRDSSADVYALGAVLYELIVGRRPFEAETIEGVMRAHLDAEPPRTGDFSAELWQVTQAALRKDPTGRYAATEVAGNLREILDSDLVAPQSLPTSSWRSDAMDASKVTARGTRAVRIAVIMATVTLLVGTFTFALLDKIAGNALAVNAEGVGATQLEGPIIPASAAVSNHESVNLQKHESASPSRQGIVDPPKPVDPPKDPPKPVDPPKDPPKPVDPPKDPVSERPAGDGLPLGRFTETRSSTLSDGRTLEVTFSYTRLKEQYVWHRVTYRLIGDGGPVDLNFTVYQSDTKAFFTAVSNDRGRAKTSMNLKDTKTSRTKRSGVLVQAYMHPKKTGSRLGDEALWRSR